MQITQNYSPLVSADTHATANERQVSPSELKVDQAACNSLQIPPHTDLDQKVWIVKKSEIKDLAQSSKTSEEMIVPNQINIQIQPPGQRPKISSEMLKAQIWKREEASHSQIMQTNFSRSATPHIMGTLAGTQNPVAKVELFYIPKAVAQDRTRVIMSLDDAKAKVATIINRCVTEGSGNLKRQKNLWALGAQSALSEGTGSYRDKIVAKLKSDLKVYPDLNSPESKFLSKLIKDIDNAFATIDCNHVPVVIKKDDLLSSIAAYQSYITAQIGNIAKPDEHYQSLNQSLNALANMISKERGLFVNQSILDEPILETTNGDQTRSFRLDENASRFLKKNTSEYYSSFDLMQAPANYGKEGALNELRHIQTEHALISQAKLSFKLGKENARELLASHINSLTELNPFMVIKTKREFNNAQLANQANPQGITSAWLQGEPINTKDHRLYSSSLQDLNEQRYAGEVPSDQTLQDFELAKGKLMSAVSDKSVIAHAIQDIMLLGYDSHINQYIVSEDDKHAYCFDYARLLAPSICYKSGASDEHTCVALRSAFLDFPAATLPIPTEFIERIKSLDMSKIEDTLRSQGMVADASSVKIAKEQIASIKEVLVALQEAYGVYSLNKSEIKQIKEYLAKVPDNLEDQKEGHRLIEISTQAQTKALEGIKNICAQYNFTYDEEDIEACVASINNQLTDQSNKITEPFMHKVHPQAMESWNQRVGRMQDYVNSDPSPTAKGMRDHVFSELKVFFDVLSRSVESPSSYIGIKKILGEPVTATNLESIIELAKTRKTASEQELDQMKTNLAILREQACDRSDLSLTMDL